MGLPMETIFVELSDRSYPIHIGHDLMAQLAQSALASVNKTTHAVLVADEAVVEPHANKVRESLHQANIRTSFFTVKSGEASKSMDELSRILQFMAVERTDRASIVVAIGGGVVGDLAGFAAATFARGLRWIQVPTTLLAHVDSSVGGKTGINLPQGKNLVGAFWQPNVVVIDIQSLDSLPAREFRSGLAEVVKYGMILDVEFFEWLESRADAILRRDPSTLQKMIRRCCELKAQVVVEDEREISGRRAVLNYGHTFGHAIEGECGYGGWLHGEAVSIGMNMAANLACLLGRISRDIVARQNRLLARMGLPLSMERGELNALWEWMQRDKKVENGVLSFVLPDRIGHVEKVSGVPRESVLQAMEWSQSSDHRASD